MNVQVLIDDYIDRQPKPKRRELRELHDLVTRLSPGCRLWFLDGRDEHGKVVSNPNIGYGVLTIQYAGGKTREFYRVGLSANTTGISLYVMGLEDKTYLARTYGGKLGKASVTGYCIKFKRLSELDRDVLEDVIRFGMSDRD